MRKILENGVLVLLALGVLYVGRSQVIRLYESVYNQVLPCSKPIAYHVEAFDPRFGISEAEFKSAIAQAESIWEKAAGKELFVYSDTGPLAISLTYDYRQEATDTLRKLGLVVKDDRASYDTLKEKYDSLEAVYTQKKAAYDAAVAEFTKQRDDYDTQVELWNRRGGAPRDVYDSLQQEKASLASKLTLINEMRADLKDRVSTINALVAELNRIATTLNITASQFNQIGSARGEEFTEGVYASSADGETIDIYQFDSKQKLVRVLAHELGHALNLEHVEDPKAIMYRLNQGTNETLAPADIAELQALCGSK